MAKTLKMLILIVVLLVGAILLLKSGVFNSLSNIAVSNTDYNAVAEDFIKKNIFISRKVGKVERITQYGSGGEAGPQSYNVYTVNGTDRTAVCYITLVKDKDGSWSVTESTLSVDGSQFQVPVKQSKNKKATSRFKFK
jgi:hypothetical protein